MVLYCILLYYLVKKGVPDPLHCGSRALGAMDNHFTTLRQQGGKEAQNQEQIHHIVAKFAHEATVVYSLLPTCV